MTDRELEKVLFALSQNIRKRRKGLGLSQLQLAYKCKINKNYISGIEQGKKNITLGMLLRIKKGLDCELTDLFKEE